MKSAKFFNFMMTAVFALGQAACTLSANLDGGTGAPEKPFGLADITGNWQSKCALMGSGYIQHNLNISTTTYKDVIMVYSDAACSQQIPVQADPVSGAFYVEGNDNYLFGGIDIRMTYVDQNHVTQTGYGLALLDSETLYLASYLGTNLQSRPISVDRSLPYKRVIK